MSQRALNGLLERFPDAVIAHHTQCGDETAVLEPRDLREVAQWLRDECGFDLLRDVTAVDYQDRREWRFEVVYHLYSLAHRHSLRLKARLSSRSVVLESLADLWPASGRGEREVFDMFGIRFAGHPFLRRVHLYQEFVGHPLRKDYDKRQAQPRLELRHVEHSAVEEYEEFTSRRGESKEP